MVIFFPSSVLSRQVFSVVPVRSLPPPIVKFPSGGVRKKFLFLCLSSFLQAKHLRIEEFKAIVEHLLPDHDYGQLNA